MAASMEHVLLRQFRSLKLNVNSRRRATQFMSRARYLCTSNKTENSQSKGGDSDQISPQPGLQDPLPIFLDGSVWRILRRITGFEIDDVFRTHYSPAAKPVYKLLTDQELQQAQNRAERKGRQKLQMPPVMKSRDPITEVLSHDPEVEGVIQSKLVCTDITFGITDRKRIIVVRDIDGTLRPASWDERDRINQIYNPQPGRTIFPPKLFEPENFEDLLDKEWYLYVLDRACVQFEPDHPEYVRVTQRTYEHICDRKKFDVLRSTRHFGPMAFYFAWYKKIEPLLMDMLQWDLLSDAVQLIQLYHIINQTRDYERPVIESDMDKLYVIKMFADNHAGYSYKGQLELTVQAYEESQKSQGQQEELQVS